MKLRLFPNLILPPFAAGLFMGLAVLATAIVIRESLVATGAQVSITHFDKVMHFVSYGVLAGLWGLAFRVSRLTAVTIALIGLGTGLEIAQQAMGLGRTGSIWDGLANAAGAVLGAFMLTLLFKTADDGKGSGASI